MKNTKSQICYSCNTEKEMSIGKKRGNIYYRNVCVNCYKQDQKEKSRKYYEKNKEMCNKKSIEWSSKNKEKKNNLNLRRLIPERKEKYSITKSEWRKNNKDKELQYNKNRTINMTPLQRLKNNMRNSIRLYLERNGFIKKSKTEIILGCSFDEFKYHLESKFETWMNWDNHGKFNGEYNHGWDIDHIIPLSSASTEEEILKLNHYTNLQPLCSKVNRHEKRDRY
jgi:hypothetical protein